MGQTQKKTKLNAKLAESDSSSNYSATDWIDEKCDHFHSITITKKSVRAEQNVTLYGHEHILGQFYFCVEILKMSEDGWMSIGISDAHNAIREKPSIEKTDWVFYKSFGQVIANLNCINSKCKRANVGDRVEMSGNISTGIVEWRLNKNLFIRHKLENFENKDIKWILLLHLSSKTELKLVQSLISMELIIAHLSLSLFSWDDDLLREIDQISEKSAIANSEEVQLFE